MITLVELIVIFLVFLFVIARVLTIIRSYNEQVAFTKFPEDCADWSVERGCTRVLLKNDECIRTEDISLRYHIVY